MREDLKHLLNLIQYYDCKKQEEPRRIVSIVKEENITPLVVYRLTKETVYHPLTSEVY